MTDSRYTTDATLDAGRVIVIEAPRIAGLQSEIGNRLRALESTARPIRVLDCDARKGGIWAGLADWLRDLHPQIAERAPELVQRHSHELVTVVPSLRRVIRSTSLTLTDQAPADETVRNYAIDRGYRIGHGAIDLLAEWHRLSSSPGAIVVCLGFEHAGALVQRFFRNLVRRRGEALNLTLVAVTEPGAGETVAASFPDGVPRTLVAWRLEGDPTLPPDPHETGRRAEELEATVAREPLELEIYLAELIHLWENSDQPRRALRWKAFALGLYNHYGFYEDGLRYVEPVLKNLDSIEPIEGFEYFFTRWNLVGSVFGCLVANGYADRARRVVEDEALAKIDGAEERVRIHYVMSMLHARFLDESNLDLAEHHLKEGLGLLETETRIQERDRVFLTVFLNNGLAFIRHRQRRPHEAIELCRDGFERMNRHWGAKRHRLHQSVLLYNQAQVYAALGAHGEAVEKFTQALEMDPNYSEYYNERGSVFLAMGRFEEAIADYEKAIETSPPYPEVWTNLGQCHRKRGHFEAAVAAYSHALDLEPANFLARVGRAQALDVVERLEEAEEDYTRALAINSEDPLLWANRAVLEYQRGALRESLDDLDRAIQLAPEEADLYQNRAVALEGLGRSEDAAHDLRTYLRLQPNAADRPEVEARIMAAASTGAA